MMISNRDRERGAGREVEQVGTGLEAGFVLLYCTSLKAHFLTLTRDKKETQRGCLIQIGRLFRLKETFGIRQRLIVQHADCPPFY